MTSLLRYMVFGSAWAVTRRLPITNCHRCDVFAQWHNATLPSSAFVGNTYGISVSAILADAVSSLT